MYRITPETQDHLKCQKYGLKKRLIFIKNHYLCKSKWSLRMVSQHRYHCSYYEQEYHIIQYASSLHTCKWGLWCCAFKFCDKNVDILFIMFIDKMIWHHWHAWIVLDTTVINCSVIRSVCITRIGLFQSWWCFLCFPEESSQSLDVRPNMGAAMAYSYFYGYLRIILPGIYRNITGLFNVYAITIEV